MKLDLKNPLIFLTYISISLVYEKLKEYDKSIQILKKVFFFFILIYIY
jgi:hypothetical protein